MINLFKKVLIFFLLVFSFFGYSAAISQYEKIYMPLFMSNGELVIAIRIFKKQDTPHVLLVHTNTLLTEVYPLKSLYIKNPQNNCKPKLLTHQQIQNSRYYQLFFEHTQENQGVKHALNHINGNILTVDLCPSSRSFEKAFFDKLANSPSKPFPVAISISGLWMVQHPQELNYLIELQQQKKLDITWVNHTFSHIYYSDLPDKKNFLLTEMVNLDTEILLTEQYLLEHDQTPSVFFRFPGLISNYKLLKQLKKYGLIPLSADAWLANDQNITPGGIVLVHGNGNEHDGIKLIEPYIKKLHWIILPGNV